MEDLTLSADWNQDYTAEHLEHENVKMKLWSNVVAWNVVVVVCEAKSIIFINLSESEKVNWLQVFEVGDLVDYLTSQIDKWKDAQPEIDQFDKWPLIFVDNALSKLLLLGFGQRYEFRGTRKPIQIGLALLMSLVLVQHVSWVFDVWQ